MKKTYSYEYEELASASELNDVQQNLLQQAQQVLEQAYAPYSNFHVGAAVLLEDGTIVTGTNVENASYPVGICAERTALSNVLSNYPKAKVKAMAISYINASKQSNEPAYPCGMCRQFMAEVEGRNGTDIELILAGLKGKVILLNRWRKLLPFNFENSQLK